MVAASTRSIAPRSAVGKKRITNTVVDELRVILKRRDVAHVKALVADFATRHRLTHRDVDALLVALAQADSTGGSQTSVITPTPGDSTTAPRIADRPGTKTPAGGEGIEERNAPSFDSAKESDSDALANDDLAWMFGEEPEFPTPRAADDLVGEAFDDLLGDWTRTGGLLSRGEVALLATKRGLSPAQHAELLSLLEAAGVEQPGQLVGHRLALDGLVEGDVNVIGRDLPETCMTLLDRMLGGGGELVTLVLGADAPDGLGEALTTHLAHAWPFVEVRTYDGGQPHHPLLVGVE